MAKRVFSTRISNVHLCTAGVGVDCAGNVHQSFGDANSQRGAGAAPPIGDARLMRGAGAAPLRISAHLNKRELVASLKLERGETALTSEVVQYAV